MSHMTELSIENTCRGCLNSEHIFLLPLIICKAGKSQVSVKCQEHSVETGAFCCKFAFPPTFQCPSNKKSGAFQKIAELFLFLKCHGRINASAKPELEELLYIWWIYTAIKSPSLRWKVYTTKYVDIRAILHKVLVFQFSTFFSF